MPRVSVIINVYNGEATLRETIESVLAQTFADWELIIWDDGSTDHSAAIIRSYSDPRIHHYFSGKNEGLGPSRVNALQQSHGEWFAFVDQDDLWMADKLALQIEKVDEHPNTGFVYGRTVRFFPNGKTIDYDHRHEFRLLPEGKIFERLFIDSCFIAISSALFSRRAYDSIPAIPTDIKTCPDYYLYLAIAKDHSVAAVQSVVCRYRVHASNMTRSNGRRMQLEILSLIDFWSHALPPDLAAHRRRVHSTVLAVDQMQSVKTFIEGIRTLLVDGGLVYLASRPFARAFRSTRRRIITPCWQRLTPTARGPRPIAK